MPENSFVDVKLSPATKGSVYFASDVISTIAGLALTEIEGIANIIKYNGLRNDKNSKKNAINIKSLTKGIKADVKDNKVSLSITGVIEYGYSVPEVCRAIQENVKKTVETMTGMTVENVDVHITSLSVEKENAVLDETNLHTYIANGANKVITEASENKTEEE